MSKIYTTAQDFIDRELTILGEAPDGFDPGKLFDRCSGAGLIFYDAGFRWVSDSVEDPEMPEWAKLWGLIEQLSIESGGVG